MTKSGPNESVAEALLSHKKTVSTDKLTRIVERVRAARDLEALVNDLTERLREAQASLSRIYREELPGLFDEAGTSVVGLPAEGNAPAYEARLKPYYSANIAASWPQEKRKEAFAFLESRGSGDLIKTNLSLAFRREDRDEAKELAKLLQQEVNAEVQVNEAVHTSTLKAWLKEQVENGEIFSPEELAAIGGDIGRVVTLKEQK